MSEIPLFYCSGCKRNLPGGNFELGRIICKACRQKQMLDLMEPAVYTKKDLWHAWEEGHRAALHFAEYIETRKNPYE